MIKEKISAYILAVSAIAASTGVHAQSYPNHVVNVVVNAGPGGNIDILARVIAQHLSDDLKQNFIVTNKDGASGLVGARQVAFSKADGYTLLFGSSQLAIAPFGAQDNSLDLERDLTPITEVAASPLVMVTNPKIPANNPRELADYIKLHESEFRWGIPGFSTPSALGVVQFDKMVGVHPVIVPYASTTPQMVAVLGGEVGGGLISPGPIKADVQSGKLRVLAVSSLEISEWMPGVPTIASFNFPGYNVDVWYGMWGPKNLPRELAAEIHKVIVHVLNEPDVLEKFKAAGVTPTKSESPAEFRKLFGQLIRTNEPLLKEAQSLISK